MITIYKGESRIEKAMYYNLDDIENAIKAAHENGLDTEGTFAVYAFDENDYTRKASVFFEDMASALRAMATAANNGYTVNIIHKGKLFAHGIYNH